MTENKSEANEKHAIRIKKKKRVTTKLEKRMKIKKMENVRENAYRRDCDPQSGAEEGCRPNWCTESR